MSETVCTSCGKTLTVGEWPWCPHGMSTAPSVIGDDIPGGFVQEHFGDKPEVFYSKKDMARRAKELGLVPFVRHVDGDKHVSRWV